MDTAKVIVRRTKKGEETVTSFSYFDARLGDGTQQFYADPEKDEFDMTPVEARAAIATGAFEVSPDSKSTIEEAEAAEREALVAATTPLGAGSNAANAEQAPGAASTSASAEDAKE